MTRGQALAQDGLGPVTSCWPCTTVHGRRGWRDATPPRPRCCRRRSPPPACPGRRSRHPWSVGPDAGALERGFAVRSPAIGLGSGRQNIRRWRRACRLLLHRTRNSAAPPPRAPSACSPSTPRADVSARVRIFAASATAPGSARRSDPRRVLDVRRGHQLSAGLEVGQHQRFPQEARAAEIAAV